jgi:hypothetical protein
MVLVYLPLLTYKLGDFVANVGKYSSNHGAGEPIKIPLSHLILVETRFPVHGNNMQLSPTNQEVF